MHVKKKHCWKVGIENCSLSTLMKFFVRYLLMERIHKILDCLNFIPPFSVKRWPSCDFEMIYFLSNQQMIPCHRFGLTCHFFVILGVSVCRTGLMVKCPVSDFCEAISSFYIITYCKNINLGYHLISYLTLLNIDLVLYWSRKREVVAYMLAGREINMTCHLLACKIHFWGSICEGNWN